jgi:hypothetical protein
MTSMGHLKFSAAELHFRTGRKILTRVGNTADREEVAATQWVDRERLPEFLAEVQASGGQLTPWFQLISQVGRECITRLELFKMRKCAACRGSEQQLSKLFK